MYGRRCTLTDIQDVYHHAENSCRSLTLLIKIAVTFGVSHMLLDLSVTFAFILIGEFYRGYEPDYAIGSGFISFSVCAK
eukprot:6967223-Karenia_brevis.AAC.1